jgi:hypothetical protein
MSVFENIWIWEMKCTTEVLFGVNTGCWSWLDLLREKTFRMRFAVAWFQKLDIRKGIHYRPLWSSWLQNNKTRCQTGTQWYYNFWLHSICYITAVFWFHGIEACANGANHMTWSAKIETVTGVQMISKLPLYQQKWFACWVSM